MTQKSSEEVLLICDLNIFVMAYLFNPSKMLNDNPYTFGKIFIHQTVLDELSLWLTSGAKKKKFGTALITSMIQKCGEMVVEKPILAEQEEKKFFSRIRRIELALSDGERSTDTSRPDKMYLSLAMKLSANIATQEKTLRSISQKTIGSKRSVVSFTDMLLDRFKDKKIEPEEIRAGLDNLNHYDEGFIRGNKKKILDAIK